MFDKVDHFMFEEQLFWEMHLLVLFLDEMTEPTQICSH